MNIYLASPFFNKNELAFYEQALKVLRNDKGLNVYAPYENEIDKNDKSKFEWATATFQKDIQEIEKADAIVVLFYGLYSDSGTAWECGYAYGKGKPVIVVHLHEGKSNCMINCGSHANVIGIDGLKRYSFEKLEKVNYYDAQISG